MVLPQFDTWKAIRKVSPTRLKARHPGANTRTPLQHCNVVTATARQFANPSDGENFHTVAPPPNPAFQIIRWINLGTLQQRWVSEAQPAPRSAASVAGPCARVGALLPQLHLPPAVLRGGGHRLQAEHVDGLVLARGNNKQQPTKNRKVI